MSKLHATDTLKVYLFPGQGADYRLFSAFSLEGPIDTIYIHYPVPEKSMSMQDYARSLLPQIDTTQPHVLIGVSLGGMLCTELHEITHPEKTILISSAKCRSELLGRYRFMKSVPIYKAVPRRVIKSGAFLAQPLFEPDRKANKETFVNMLKAKDSRFLKNSINLIVRWDRTVYAKEIIHIHGDNDHTLPVENVKANFIIPGGSHMMALTRAAEVCEIIQRELSQLLPQREKDLKPA